MTVLDCPIAKNDWVLEVQRDGIIPKATPPAMGKMRAEAGTWEPVVAKLISFHDIADDWDGFGAKAPGRELLESAVGLAHILSEKGINPPNGVLHGVAGTVIFEWQFQDGTYAEVEIDRPLHAEVMLVEPGKPAKHWTLPTE